MTIQNGSFLFDFDIMFIILEKLIDLKKIGDYDYISSKFLNEITKLEATNKMLMSPFKEYLEKNIRKDAAHSPASQNQDPWRKLIRSCI